MRDGIRSPRSVRKTILKAGFGVTLMRVLQSYSLFKREIPSCAFRDNVSVSGEAGSRGLKLT